MMKLPDKNNKYKHNEYCDEVFRLARVLAHGDHNHPHTIKEICEKNWLTIKAIHAKILHLELVIDEVMKLSEVSDGN